MTVPPTGPATLPPFLARIWGLEAAVEPLGGEGDNWLVRTADGALYVLKVGGPDFTAAEAELEHVAAEAVHAAEPALALPRPIPTLDGATAAPFPTAEDEVEPPSGGSATGTSADSPTSGTGSRLARLLAFVPGTPWHEAAPASEALLEEAGRRVGGVTRALAGVEHPAARRTHRWNLARAGALRDRTSLVDDPAGRRRVTEAFRLHAGAVPFLDDVPWGLVHGDLNDENVLVEGDRVVGLLDFGDALHNPLVCDLAIALTYLLLDQPEPWSAGARVVAGYHAVRPLSATEAELLFPLACGRLAVSLVTAAERRRIDPDRDAWFVTEERARAALARYLEVPPAEAARRWTTGIDVEPWPHRGATLEEALERRRARFSGALSVSYDAPLKLTRGRGSYLFDRDGRPHLDLYNNVCHVGHCHPRVVAAGRRQMARLNTNTRYLYDALLEYAERLSATLPPGLDRCFFVNSGSEANELALRLARTHTGHRDVVVLENAYHGHTSTLVDVSPYKFDGPGGEGRKPWVHVAPMPDGYRGPHRGQGRDAGTAYGEAVGRVVDGMERPPAAFLAESLPSVGGQIVPPEGYFETAFAHVRAAGGLCILDEVQVGFGRVGTHFWGFEQQGVVPDMVVLGKPMGNGHPMGAVVTTEAVARSFAEAGMEFFSTFGGNPVSCAIGTAVLDVVEDEGLQDHALEVGTALRDGLRALVDRHPVLGDVRGTGLFLGVELVEDRETREPATGKARRLVEALRRRRILTGTDGPFENVVKIKPPMVLAAADAALTVEVVDELLADPSFEPER